MKIGLFSNGQRTNPVAKTSYDEDLYEVILADELGIQEAWISEHGTLLGMQAPDQLPCADLFICKAAALTKQIRMGPGIRPLPFFHPLQVATDCAVCDHLTDGRYMAGFGLGIGTGNGQRGELPGDRRVMMREAIEIILTAWTAEDRFDWEGEIWQGKDWHIIPKPYTKPYMEVGMACSRSEGTLQLAAEKGFYPLMSWTPKLDQLANMVDMYLTAEGPPARPPSRDEIRISRFVYVADSVDQAKRDLGAFEVGMPVLQGRLDGYIPEGGSRDDLTMEYLIDSGLFFCGDPDSVFAQIKDLYERTGGFGVFLLTCGKDWGSHDQRARSMRLFMEEIAPRLDQLPADAALAA
ncbi:MAG: LLM class flavin-dependent oxidoreductase [Alphaproteobacteria bacterium]|nr:LLM class flavin-dependent oxidoreductase [Alphaproteobacteria bacterium]